MGVDFSDEDLGLAADCVDAIGTSDFPRLIIQFCAGLCDADTVFLCAFFDDHKPIALYGNRTDAASAARNPRAACFPWGSPISAIPSPVRRR